jgi:hypothetical protein
MANLPQAQLDQYLAAQKQGYMNPVTGEWISQAGAGYTGDGTGNSVSEWGQTGPWGQDPALLRALGYAPDSQYIYGNGGEHGTGKLGDQYNILDSKGVDTGKMGTYSTDRGLGREMLMGALMMAGGALAGGAFGGAAAGAGGGAGVPWEAGFVGTDALGGAGGALGAAGAGGGAALGAGGGGAIGTMAPLELLPAGMGEYALPGLMGTAGAAGAGGAAGGAASGLLGGNGSSLLGLGASVLGGLAGAQGQKNETTTTRDIPAELKPYIYGENGLLSQTMGQLNASRSPARMQEWADIRNRGMGLLQKPVAGNPTAGWTFNR